MTERHTVDFARVSFNVISDADRAAITLQFDQTPGASESIQRILKAIERRFGRSITSRLRRWSTGETASLILPSGGRPHPEYPDVLCYEIAVNQGARMETALATLLDFLCRQPEYKRTYGPPLDRDEVPQSTRRTSTSDPAAVAHATLLEFFNRRRERTK